MSERVSIREFSRRVGVSDTAIRKALASGRIRAEAVVQRASGRPELLLDLAMQDWQASTSGKELHHRAEQTKGKVSERRKNYPKSDEQAPVEPPSSGGGVSYAEAKRQAAIFDAKRKGLELAELQGMLVNKDKVFKAFFEYGQVVRSGILSVPDRFIDEILACKTRNEAHLVLQRALTEELLRLTDASKITFSDR